MNEQEITDVIREIRRALDEIATEAYGDQADAYPDDAAWTRRIKERLARIGKTRGYRVYAEKCAGVDGGEWLYDLTWLRYDAQGVLRELALALESEWSVQLGNAEDDFEKLIVARASLRVMIYQARDKEAADRKRDELRGYAKAFREGRAGEPDHYLFCGWSKADRSFICVPETV